MTSLIAVFQKRFGLGPKQNRVIHASFTEKSDDNKLKRYMHLHKLLIAWVN